MNTTTKETFEQRWERAWKAIDACTKKPSEVRRLVTIDAATQNETNAGADECDGDTMPRSATSGPSAPASSFDHRAEFLADFEAKTKLEIHPFTPNRDKLTPEQREIADADHDDTIERFSEEPDETED